MLLNCAKINNYLCVTLIISQLLIFFHTLISRSCLVPCFRYQFFLYLFLHALHCFNLLHLAISLTKKNISRIILIKFIIIKVNIINVWSKKVRIITKLCKNIRVYINKVYIIINEQKVIKFFKYCICNKAIKNVGRKTSTALSYISLILNLSRQYYNIKRSFEATLSHISCVLCQSPTESDTK